MIVIDSLVLSLSEDTKFKPILGFSTTVNYFSNIFNPLSRRG